MFKRVKMHGTDWLCLLIFILAAAICFSTTVATSLNLLDSDASSELILANHLHETGNVLSDDWYYSTELRVLNTQLIFAPLFGLFSSWRRVRLAGTLLLQLILVASYGYMIWQAGRDKKTFFLGSAMLLLPICVSYGRLVLTHAYYIPHIAISFFTIGHFLGCMNALKKQGRARIICLTVYLLLYLSLSLGGALGGFRQPAVTQAPLCLLALVVLWKARSKDQRREGMQLLVLALCGTAAALVGLKINEHWHGIYRFASFGQAELNLISPENFHDFLFGLLHQFGFRRGIPAISLLGLLSIAAIGVCVYFLFNCVRTVRDEALAETAGINVLRLMLPCGMMVGMALFVLNVSPRDSERYLIPYSVWLIPLLCEMIFHCPVRRLMAYGVCAVCLCNGVVNARFLAEPTSRHQHYEGLTWTDTQSVERYSPIRDYLLAEGYDLGYCTFWNGNLLTEMSDGQLRFCNLDVDEDTDKLIHYNWLMLESNRSRPAQKPFLLLNERDLSRLNADDLNQRFRLVHTIDTFRIYEPIDLAAWRAELEASPSVP